MEDGAGEQAEDGSAEEHHDWPPRDFLGVRLVLLQFQDLEVLRIDFAFEFLYLLLERAQPGGIERFGDFLDEQGSQFEFELALGPLELGHVLLEDLLDVALDAFYLGLQGGLELVRTLVELLDELLVVGHHALLELTYFRVGLLGEAVVLGQEREVIDSVHVVIEAVLQPGAVLMERAAHRLAVDHYVEGEEEEEDEERGEAVAPDVHALVMQHEEAAHYLARGVEVYAVAMGYVVVVLHELRRSLVVSDVLLLLARTARHILLATLHTSIMLHHNSIANSLKYLEFMLRV